MVQDPRFVVDEDAWETRDVTKLIKSEALPFDAATSDEEYLEVPLPNFPENDTLILHVSVAADVDIWAMNLCPGDHDDGASILYHFNPRRRERGGRLVENDKSEDDWGRAVKNTTSTEAGALWIGEGRGGPAGRPAGGPRRRPRDREPAAGDGVAAAERK